MATQVPDSLIQLLRRQKYHIVGRHSAVKKCRWLHETLVNERPCYKQKFYGIKTHRCLQMTPALFSCTQKCLFCWRTQSGDDKLKWNERNSSAYDDPKEVVENCVKEQRAILSGYRDNSRISRQKLTEALNPSQAAISLAGEPTLYQKLAGLITEFHLRGFTTFLVSNGTRPRELEKLDQEPTQLYISACAPDKTTYLRVCRPQIPNAWEAFNETLSLLPSFKCPTVLRITLASKLNMTNIEGYTRIIEKAKPTYVEPKAYMHVGFSRLRIGFENTPSHEQVRTFAEQIATETGYRMIDESAESRVVLLSKLEKPISIDTRS